MTKKTEEDLPTRDEAIRIGDWTRTPRIWKANGNARTLGKALRRFQREEKADLERQLGKVK